MDTADLAVALGDGAAGDGEEGAAGPDVLGPRAQVVLTGSWGSMRDASLLLGALPRALPLSGASCPWVQRTPRVIIRVPTACMLRLAG